ncbi:hypothetical protein M409DRAFT_22032 [Zasmidium cellare ATCC 36951]|uniref:Ecp2 effector protein domain-containing protein n=1 Tax=Zasmidium cellare ATCC 36951 TaxID=1080233 RepID=A0A6A6CKZ6_ZASCE|nr:uncharacterized protein M409DRAFT_22032 [Zasmidium cellare ATCC 36951]KAF2167884.1 hypothetical protein M409DRAFT_22032 [Zasmidium cellare ATCC 36951]
MRFTALTTAALLASSALAAPTPSPQPSLAPNTATCALTYKIYSGAYTVNIGRPFHNGAGCDYVKAALKSKVELATNFKCKDDGSGQTVLSWKTNMKQTKANEGLQKAYPMIDFVGGKVCDPYLP